MPRSTTGTSLPSTGTSVVEDNTLQVGIVVEVEANLKAAATDGEAALRRLSLVSCRTPV